MVVEIKQTRFEALSYGRHPISAMIGPEIGWFETNEGRVLGVLIFDVHDNDFSYVVLARDSDKIFKAVGLRHSIATKDEAIQKLQIEMEETSKATDESFYQDELKKKFDIYDLKVQEDKLHNHFKTLQSSETYSPAREVIKEMVFAFKDPDGNYIEQFQTSGFNSRLWPVNPLITNNLS